MIEEKFNIPHYLPFGLVFSYPLLVVANKVRYSGYEDYLVY